MGCTQKRQPRAQSDHLSDVPVARVPQPRRETRLQTRRLYRDFRGSPVTSIAKPMFSISFRILMCHFSTSFPRNLSPGIISSRTIELSVKKAIQKHVQTSPSTRNVRLRFGPNGSVRDRFRSTLPFRFFGLRQHCSVSRFGFGRSADGADGKAVTILQLSAAITKR